jgi:hypothetical protein
MGSITLDPEGASAAIILPPGLVWEDEFDWQPVVQSTEYTLSGAIIIEESERLEGRPITLVGGRTGLVSWAWMARDEALALKSALDTPGVVFTLTLHDARTFRVVPRHSDGQALEAFPLPIVGDRAPAAPGGNYLYVVDRIRLMQIA